MSVSDNEAARKGALTPEERAWRRRCRIKRIKHAFEIPFEWLGIGLGFLLLTSFNHRLMLALCDAAAAVMYTFDRVGRRRSLEMLHVMQGRCELGEGTADFDADHAPYRPTPREEKSLRVLPSG